MAKVGKRHLHKPVPSKGNLRYFASTETCLVCGARRAISPYGIGPWYLENQRMPYCLLKGEDNDG